MTDFRALCAELLQELCCHYRSWELKEGYCSDAMTRAQAALAQPKPQGPTDEELLKLSKENNWNHVSPETFLDIARTVIGFSAQ